MKCLLFFPLRSGGKGDSIQAPLPSTLPSLLRASEVDFSHVLIFLAWEDKAVGAAPRGAPSPPGTTALPGSARGCSHPAVGQEMLSDQEEMLGDQEEMLGDQKEMLGASRMTLGKPLHLCMLGHLSPARGRHLLLSLCLSPCPTSVPVRAFETYPKQNAGCCKKDEPLESSLALESIALVPGESSRAVPPLPARRLRNISSDLLYLLHFSLGKWVKVLQEFDGQARNRAQVLSVRV